MKIKLTVPWLSSDASLEEYTGSADNTLNGFQFFVNSKIEEPDVWIVFDDGVEGDSAIVDPANIWMMTAEICYPIGRFDDERGQRYLNQFSKFFTCHDIFDERTHFTRPFLQWWINSNHGFSTYPETKRGRKYFEQVKGFEKLHDLSVICSSKAFTPEHYARLKFVSRLKEDLGDRLHWFGNGIQAIPDKFPAIAPYRYHLVIENRFGRDIISEKLYDSYLGLAYPIYHGAPNVTDYFSEWSLTQINIYDYKRSRNQILELIDSDWAERQQPDLLRAKYQTVNEHNWVDRMALIARLYGNRSGSRERITLNAF